MSRRLLLTFALVWLWAAPLAAQGAAPGSARAVALRSLAAQAAHNPSAFVRDIDPADLAAFRLQLLPSLKEMLAGQQQQQALRIFAPAKTYADIEKLSVDRLYAMYIKGAWDQAPSGLVFTNTILGEVPEGSDLSHLVYRQRVRAGEREATSVTLMNLRRTPGGWKVQLEGVHPRGQPAQQ